MFDELNKYKTNGHFFFRATDAIEQVCNMPESGHGVCIIYELKHGRVDMVYIGGSGSPNKLEYNSIKNFILKGRSFSTPRSKEWAVKMLAENIDALDVYWWITDDKMNNDDPLEIELDILDLYIDLHGDLPRWNTPPSKKSK
ncbi:hypothetical protein [Mucilaginibacter sp. HD30]